MTIATAVTCGFVYAAGPLLPRIHRSRRAVAWWPAAVGAVWPALPALTPHAIWVASPLYFLQLHLLRRRAGLASVIATAVAAIAGFAAHIGSFGPAMAIGPAVAVAVVWGYQALYRESEQRRQLIEELTATRADLAWAQHTAGALAERERLAREIHDTSPRASLAFSCRCAPPNAPYPAGPTWPPSFASPSPSSPTPSATPRPPPPRSPSATSATTSPSRWSTTGTASTSNSCPPPTPKAGASLAAMRARRNTLGGILSIESTPGHGTALTTQLPLTPPTKTEPEARL
nr:hypothetical protein [Nocardia brevicatena]